MTKRQINKVRMFRTVRDYLGTLEEDLSSAGMYSTLLRRFDGLLAAVDVAADYQTHGARGKVAAHRVAQEKMRSMLVVVGGVVHAYARTAGDEEFLMKTNVTRSALVKMRAEDALRIAEHIYDKALTVRDALAPYWLSSGDVLCEFRSVLDEAQVALVARYQSDVLRVSSSRAIRSIIADTDAFLTEELDRFLEQYLTCNPEAQLRYEIARRTHRFGMKRFGATGAPQVLLPVASHESAASRVGAGSSAVFSSDATASSGAAISNNNGDGLRAECAHLNIRA